MKHAILSIAVFFLSNLAQAPALTQTPRALEISIFGIGPAVDSEAVRSVRRVIGRAVSRGVVDTYITYGYGREGGSTSCIQLSPFEDNSSLLQLERELLQIRPNPNTTSYNVEAVAACSQQTTNSVQSEQLADTQWLLEDLGGTGAIALPQKLTLRFIGTDRIAGQGGCNLFSGQSQINGDQFAVSALVSTKRACIEPRAQEQENRYFRALETAQRISFSEPYLLIYSEGSDAPLRFSRLGTSN